MFHCLLIKLTCMILSHDRIEHISHTCYVTSLRPLFRPWIINFPEAVYLFKIILQISFSLTFTILISYLKIFQKVMIVTREGVKTFWQRLINFRQGRGGGGYLFVSQLRRNTKNKNEIACTHPICYYFWITVESLLFTRTCDMVITAIAQLYFYKTMRLRDISR